jgi:hypothetical protein
MVDSLMLLYSTLLSQKLLDSFSKLGLSMTSGSRYVATDWLSLKGAKLASPPQSPQLQKLQKLQNYIKNQPQEII